jgi:hypothetical protein
VVLVDARHIKRVPGRKTDMKDCEWIAAALEDANIKLASMVTDILGVSGGSDLGGAYYPGDRLPSYSL